MTQKRYVMRHGDCDTSDRYFDKEHFARTNPEVSTTSGSEVMAHIVVFVFSVTILKGYVDKKLKYTVLQGHIISDETARHKPEQPKIDMPCIYC